MNWKEIAGGLILLAIGGFTAQIFNQSASIARNTEAIKNLGDQSNKILILENIIEKLEYRAMASGEFVTLNSNNEAIQNNSSKPLFISVYCGGESNRRQATGSIGKSQNNFKQVAVQIVGDRASSLSFVVPAKWYYKLAVDQDEKGCSARGVLF